MLHNFKRQKGYPSSFLKRHYNTLAAFLCGFFCAIAIIKLKGMSMRIREDFTSVSERDRFFTTGRIRNLDAVPVRPSSHRDVSTGKFIMKQSFLEPFRVPNFAGFSVATFEPGQMMMPAHSHSSIHEFFFVVEGKGMIVIDGSEHEMRPNSFIHLAPGEEHGIYLPDGIDKPMKMIVFGVFI